MIKITTTLLCGAITAFAGNIDTANTEICPAARKEILITDMAKAAKSNAWLPAEYETTDGIKGTMLYAPWGLKSRSRLEIPLSVEDKYLICLGISETKSDPAKMLVRLGRDPAPIVIDSEENSGGFGYWQQITEHEWRYEELDNDTLIVDNMSGVHASIAWIRLKPVDAIADNTHPVHDMIATYDGYHPAEDMDELLAPIMLMKGSPVKKLHYCVGNGVYAFVVPSKIALSSAYDPKALYVDEYALKCAKTYEWIEKTHPNILEELVDFTHSCGLEFHVSFRTGCWIDHMRPAVRFNEANPGDSARGIVRPENGCRDWDGTPVCRPSYAKKEVQDWFLSFYREMLIDKVDGLNLIWVRGMPAMLFEDAFMERFEKAYGCKPTGPDDSRVIELRCEILTDYMKRVKALCGKRPLSLFVHATVESCREFGIDVQRLAREGIVQEFEIVNTFNKADHKTGHDDALWGMKGFAKALAGTGATFRQHQWAGSLVQWREGIAMGASGPAMWDAADRPWWLWEPMIWASDADGQILQDWLKAHPDSMKLHTLKSLQGFNMDKYPWHTAY